MGMARKSLARSARLGLRRIGMAQQRFHYEVNGSVLETGDEILDGRQIRSSAQLAPPRSEEHTSELQSLMRISYAVFCLKKKNKHQHQALTTLQQEKQTNE